MWYWEYKIKYWDDSDEQFYINSGLTLGQTLSEAMLNIEDYYGDGIEEVQMLKPIIEGSVIDFCYINSEPDFSFVINNKEKVECKEA